MGICGCHFFLSRLVHQIVGFQQNCPIHISRIVLRDNATSELEQKQ